ncbi:MAG: response regulator [Chitinophagaceae bacterium]|nr:response regulator [Anaerolineae bacterium]
MITVQEPVFVYVEDDLPSRQIVKVLLTRVMKFSNLTLFEDSGNILSRLEGLNPPPTVFFLDIQMKPHDGYEVLHLLRGDRRYASATIIAMTANVMSNDVEQLKKEGFDGLIGKPIIKDTFPQLVERILEGKPVWFVP